MESNLPFITGLASISQTVPDPHETSPCSNTQQSWAVLAVQCGLYSQLFSVVRPALLLLEEGQRRSWLLEDAVSEGQLGAGERRSERG